MQRTESIETVETAKAADSVRSSARCEISRRRRSRDGGAMLLAVLFMMAMMVLVAMAMAPSFVQQAKRDREEEMIHRGTEYARAIKKFYKKFGRYPANLEQLDNTDQMRFLRRRFTDPLSKDGQWKLLHATDIQVITGGAMTGAPGMQMGAPGVAMPPPPGQGSSTALSTGVFGSNLGANNSSGGAQSSPDRTDLSAGDHNASSVQTSGGASPFITGSGGATGQSGSNTGTGSGQSNNSNGGQTSGAAGQTGSNNTIFGDTGVGGQTFGGGAIVGIASKDKHPTIRLFNKKKTYDEWQFIYNPIMDQINVLLRGPYNGQVLTPTQVGTPAGQLNQGSPTTSGQQPGGITQQPGGVGQQYPVQNQPNTPGNQFPPDQNQPPQQ